MGTLGAASLSNVAFPHPQKAVEFYATDDTSSTSQIEDLIHDNGFKSVPIDGLDQSICIEVLVTCTSLARWGNLWLKQKKKFEAG